MHRNSLRLAFLALPPLTVLRCVLKILFISPETGFLDGAPLVPWLFCILLGAAVLAVTVSVLRRQDAGIAALHGNRVLECAGMLCGALTLCSGFCVLWALKSPDTSVNVLPRFLRVLCGLLGLMAGAALVWLSGTSLSGAAGHSRAASLSLLLPCWQALYLVDRFISFRQVTTVSDHLLETLFALALLLFWLAHARCLAGAVPNRRRAVLFALLLCLFGVPLSVGQLIALAVFGEAVGPSVSGCLTILASCFYAACFASAANRSPTLGTETAEIA